MSSTIRTSSNTIICLDATGPHSAKTNHYGAIIDLDNFNIVEIIDLGEGIPDLQESWRYYVRHNMKIYVSDENTKISH